MRSSCGLGSTYNTCLTTTNVQPYQQEAQDTAEGTVASLLVTLNTFLKRPENA